jgi:hypothetical protein
VVPNVEKWCTHFNRVSIDPALIYLPTSLPCDLDAAMPGKVSGMKRVDALGSKRLWGHKNRKARIRPCSIGSGPQLQTYFFITFGWAAMIFAAILV